MWRGSGMWLTVAALLMLSVAGCSSATEEVAEDRVSIAHLISLHKGYPQTIVEDMAIEGVVISSDRHGEFHNRIVLQDDTGGISVCIDHDELHTLHAIGDSLRVECRGLVLGAYGRAIRLGVEGSAGYQVDALTPAQWMLHHTMLGVAPKVTPATATIGTLSARQIATLVLFESVRFVEAGERWAPEGESITRHIIDTLSPTDTLAVRIAGRAEFAHERIPSGECRVVGVLDYFGTDYQLVLIGEEGVLSREEI